MDLSGIIRIYDEQHGEIPIEKGFPSDSKFKKHRIEGTDSYYCVVGDKAVLIFQCIPLLGIEIWISYYWINESVEIYCEIDSESLEFHNMIQGRVLYRLDGLDWREIEAGQYNFIYLPFIRNKVHFFKMDVKTFDLHIDKQRLIVLAGRYPQLKGVLAKVEAKESGSLYLKFSNNSLRSIYLMGAILDSAEAEGVAGVSQELALELIEELSKGNQLKSKYRYSNEDIQTIYQAEKYLIAHLGDENILKTMNRGALYSDKFREGFKLMFKDCPKGFIFIKKMEKAKALIQENAQITYIAIILGYSKVSHLETAFLRYWSYTIKDYKQQLQDDKLQS